MSSKDYWNKREEEALKHYITDEKEYDKRIKAIYEDMLDAIQKEIDGFFGRYAKAEGISITEAKKRASTLDMEAYERKAKRYVKDREFSKTANEEMRLYNFTMKVNRLELLKANIGLELIKGYDELEKFMEEILQGRTEEELERQAGILGNTINNNSNLANAIVNASFYHATFSDRIWMYQDMMKAELSKLLQSGLIQGKNPRVLAKEIRKKFGVSRYNAERLMRTELARVQTDAQKQSFERNGFELYTFIANVGCCPICAKLDGKHFEVKDMMPGTNAAPMHPYCRCSQAPYVDDEEYEAWLDYLDNGGTTEEWEKHGKASWKKRFKESEKGTINTSGILSFGNNEVDLNMLKSEKYRKKFSRITSDSSVNNKIRKFATGTLTKNNGTNTESMLVFDADTLEDITRKTGKKNQLGVSLSDEEIEHIRAYKGKKICIHNHPTNLYPTGSDFVSAGYRKYDFGIIVTHDGKVYKYSVGSTPVRADVIDSKIDKYTKNVYNETEKRKGFMKALAELGKDYGIKWEEIK